MGGGNIGGDDTVTGSRQKEERRSREGEKGPAPNEKREGERERRGESSVRASTLCWRRAGARGVGCTLGLGTGAGKPEGPVGGTGWVRPSWGKASRADSLATTTVPVAAGSRWNARHSVVLFSMRREPRTKLTAMHWVIKSLGLREENVRRGAVTAALER